MVSEGRYGNAAKCRVREHFIINTGAHELDVIAPLLTSNSVCASGWLLAGSAV